MKRTDSSGERLRVTLNLFPDSVGRSSVLLQQVWPQSRQVSCKTISVLQPCCDMTTEYGVPSDFVRKLTVSFQKHNLICRIGTSCIF